MSQFDFPRIHFTGKSIIDPATGNNNYYFPLVTYEPITGTAVMPPRIYLDNQESVHKINKLNPFILQNLCYDQSKQAYLEIYTINTPDLFKSWSQTPLGEHNQDSEFHSLYSLILTKREKEPLAGHCPGYWNYYGTMNFSLEEVKVHSIQTFFKGKVITYSNIETAPIEIASLLGSQLTFNNSNDQNSAVMVDVTPSLSFYSQVFCDRICLQKNGEIIMEGRPLKASLRQTNLQRIVNDPSITGASGSFCTSISLENLKNGRASSIAKFFREYGKVNKQLTGVFIRYDLHEIQENQAPDYSLSGPVSNPARSNILGCLTPHYEGEMRTAAPGRLLLPDSAFLGENKLGSILAHYDTEKNLLSLDAIGSLPEVKSDSTEPQFFMYELGDMHLCLVDEINSVNEFAVIGIGKKGIDRDAFINVGGMIDIVLTEDSKAFANLFEKSALRIYANILEKKSSEQQLKMVLTECKYRILSDQTGLYAEQGDPSEKGLLTNYAEKEDCIIRGFKYGRPLKEPIEMVVMELSINPYSCGEKLTIINEIKDFKDGYKFILDTSKPTNSFYVFFPPDGGIFPIDMKQYVLNTGAFLNVRILPAYNFDKYLDPNHPEYTGKLDFNIIYNEILIHYDLIYPASGIITPFQAGYFKKIHKYLNKLMAKEYWNRYLYMPSSRDMPKAKRELLFHWLESQINEEGERSEKF